MMDKNDFDYAYDEMSDGQKQHMVNRIYLNDGIMPQKLKKYMPDVEMGTRYTHATTGQEYMLAAMGMMLGALVNLKNGRLWHTPISLENPTCATEAELEQMMRGGKFICNA